ncbi:MAG TPA: FmdE family protein, partial [Thermodesulfovibrionales bacterium]|nr:FmdE family protein [Thermodesulfovibrionales bacterium]
HSCPGLALGYRVARAAMREVAMERISEDEELVAVVENNSCAVDAIQVLTGCTFGKGNLVFRDHGKQVYTFLKRPLGYGVRISIDFTLPEESAEEKEMWTRYLQGDRSEDVLRVVHSRKARKTKAILDAPEAELLRTTKVKIALPQEAEIYQSIPCSICGEKVAEPKARVKDGRIVCIPCLEGG